VVVVRDLKSQRGYRKMSKRSIRNLTRRFDLENDDFSAVWEEIHNYPARASAIASAALLEDALRWAIEQRVVDYLCPDDLCDIFSNAGAPLCSLHAKIVMGYALGIYGPKARNDLRVIKGIRNAFAHAPRSITFETAEIVSECEHLCYLQALADRENTSLVPRSTKEMLLDTIKMIILDLSGGLADGMP
jgi:Domain of unknown function (DUF4145)